MKFRIGADHPALPGHFPGQPIVPGVVILDQVQRAIEHEAGAASRLKLSQVKFQNPLLPEEEAELTFQAQGDGFTFVVSRDATMLVTGQMNLL